MMLGAIKRTAIEVMTACLVLGAAGCATTDSPGNAAGDSAQAPRPVAGVPLTDARVTYSAQEKRLGDIVREIGEQAGGGLVLMNGLERRLIASVSFEHAPLESVAAKLAEIAGCGVQQTPSYFFLFPEGYESLRDVSAGASLPANYDGLTAKVAFGAGTQLFNVFRILSKGLNVTIVADNAVAAAHCGELSLGEAPLRDSLDAVLKSARVPAESIKVSATADFIFIYSSNRELPATQLLGGRDLVERTRSLLDERVSVDLPHRSAGTEMIDIEMGAQRLGDSLDEISRQIGYRVVAERDLHNLPVNPVAMTNVEVRMAMDLIVGQWLVSDYGYQVTDDRIVIRRRQTGE